jgi:hypothetical protein
MSNERPITDIDEGAARRYAALARSITPEDRARLAPPADLWGAIADALDESHPELTEPLSAREPESTDVRAGSPISIVADPTSPTNRRTEVAEAGGAGVVLPIRRRISTIVLSAAAAVVLVIGVVALVVSGDDGPPAGELVATGTLESLADGFEGGVELVDVDGRLGLDLDVGELPETTDGYYELWLIKDLETGEMQSLGPIDGSGRVDLPQGLDPAQYATVDISVEPLDGVPTHSGQSVLRGELDI